MRLPAVLRMPPPDVAVLLAPGMVAALRVAGRGRSLRVTRAASAVLPAGAIVADVAAPNMPDVGLVGQAVAAVFRTLGHAPGRVALVVPDAVARVSLLRLPALPARPDDREALIRWQLRKTAPFPVEQAVVSALEVGRGPEGIHVLAMLARHDVVAQYERACALAGADAGLVDLASLSVANALLGGASPPTGDWLLVHAGPEFATVAVFRDQEPLFYRHRGGTGDDGPLADLVHQTAMYYEDRLGGRGFSAVRLSGPWLAGRDADLIRRDIEARLPVDVQAVDLDGLVTVPAELAGAGAADPSVPLIGLLARERRRA